MKNTSKILLILGILLLIPSSSLAFQYTNEEIDKLNSLPENTIERYSYNESLVRGENYEDVLKRQLEQVLPMAEDQYVDYVTKSTTASPAVKTNLGSINTIVTTEAMVVRNRSTGRVVSVEDFGNPYVTVAGYGSEWNGSSPNVRRIDSKSARISQTGSLTIHGPSFSTGFDIISVSAATGAKTKPLTVVCRMSW